MTTLEQLEAEAAELYPLNEPAPIFAVRQRAAHVRAKTLGTEQLDRAVLGHICKGDKDVFEKLSDQSLQYWRRDAARYFEAAGFYVEGS